jgi:F-type H+-transporting ATPase subunit delta
MNAGVIAQRYAKALLKYVKGTEEEELVYHQASILAGLFYELPQFREAMEHNPQLSLTKRMELVDAALHGRMADALRRFIVLVDSHSRMEFFSRMMSSFTDLYRQQRNIRTGSVVSAVSQEGLRSSLEDIMSRCTGGEVSLNEKVDDSLIGGFVLQVDDLRIDASVAGQFRRIRNSLVDNDNRII